MPIYTFENPKTGEVIEVIQKMSDPHAYIDEVGVEWRRVWHSPNASIDAEMDGSKESFLKHISNKKGTYGDVMDASREASEARVKKYGRDPVKEKYFKEYSKKRNGMKHKQDPSGNNDVTL